MPEKIKILRIFSRLNIGGPAIHTILLTAKLNDDNFESILVKGSESPAEGNMLELARQKGVKPVVIPEMGRKISVMDDCIAFCKIYKLIRKERPHIIHTHTAKAGTLGRGAGLLIKFIGKFQYKNSKDAKHRQTPKLVHTFHGHVFNGYFNKFQTNVFLRLERFLALFTDKIVTVSEKQRKEILGFGIGGGNNNKVIAVPLGLELSRFLKLDQYRGQLKHELGISPQTMLVGIIARLVPVKNHKMFLNAIAQFKKSKEKSNVKFLIIGDGELRGQLEGFVTEQRLNEEVIFLGWRKDLERIYADLDLVVLTSLNEGSPVALIEAMAAGKPVIATDVGGVSDLLGREQAIPGTNMKKRYGITPCGILIEPGNVDALTLAMEDILADNALRQKMGVEGRRNVWPKYDILRLTDDMKKLYKELVMNESVK